MPLRKLSDNDIEILIKRESLTCALALGRDISEIYTYTLAVSQKVDHPTDGDNLYRNLTDFQNVFTVGKRCKL